MFQIYLKIDYVVYNSVMEFANRIDNSGVRTAVQSDAREITQLLRRVPYSHVHVDWQLPVDWLGSPGFVALPEPGYSTAQRRSVASRLLPPRERLQGCLAATADPPPAAWVRVASVAAAADPQAALAAMLMPVVDYLRKTAVTQLGWLAIRDWPNDWLPGLGFYRANEIETYVKEDKQLPEETLAETAVPGLRIRPVQFADLAALEQIEAAAFEPLWRYSADSLNQARGQSLCFDVAELNGVIIGFQLSSWAGQGAHLARITVHPDYHGHGIGSALLAHALKTYWEHGLRRVSLNTQVDNIASQYLYRKFGFDASGQRFPVWAMDL